MTDAAGPTEDVGLKLIVAYKSVKGVLELLGSALLLGFILRGQVSGLERWAEELRHHVANPAAVLVAKLLFKYATPRYLRITALALFLDALVSLGEGYALHRRWWWAPWLVVGATGTLLPFELYGFLRHPRVGRALILIINLAVLAYLSRRTLREVAKRRTPKLRSP